MIVAHLFNQFNNSSPGKHDTPEIVVNSKYYDINQIQTLIFPDKLKSLSLFHIDACPLNENLDERQV